MEDKIKVELSKADITIIIVSLEKYNEFWGLFEDDKFLIKRLDKILENYETEFLSLSSKYR